MLCHLFSHTNIHATQQAAIAYEKILQIRMAVLPRVPEENSPATVYTI